MVEIVHVLHVVYLGEGGIASDMVFCELTEVPESEVAAHLAHGDRIVGDGTVLYPLDDGLRGTFEWLYEIDLSNAQYYFYIYY